MHSGEIPFSSARSGSKSDSPIAEFQKFETLFQKIPVAIALLRGPDAVYEKANESYLQLFNDRVLIGQPLTEALPELKEQKFPGLVTQVFETGEQYSEIEACVFLKRTSEGKLEERFFDLSFSRILDMHGKPYGVLVHAVDVTERVNSRRKAEAEAEKNARLLQFMPMPFFSVTQDWELNYINPAAERVLEIKAGDIVGKSIWDAFPGLKGSRFAEGYERAMRERALIVTEDFYSDFARWYEAWAFPFDTGLAISFFDVTDRKNDEIKFRAEKQKLEAIFFGSATPLVLFRGPDLIYEMFNAKYQELVPKRELLGKPLLEGLPELKGTPFPEHIAKVLATGESIITREEYAPLLNPATGKLEERYFDSGISRVNDGNGMPYGVIVQATEVTERVQTRKKIELALSMRDTFLSIASHELRTPITGMRLQTQMIKRALAKKDAQALSSERVTRLINQTDEGLLRINRLVDDMLDISRIQLGKLSLNREPTDFVSFTGQVVERFSDELKNAGIDVSIDSSPSRIVVSVDRFRMEQVLTNLITNAIKYAPNAPIKIALSAENGEMRMVFHDHGSGIDTENRERIFERFERLVSAGQISGMGLGLYIVRQIVIGHGGRIFVESDTEPGAKFVLELPEAC